MMLHPGDRLRLPPRLMQLTNDISVWRLNLGMASTNSRQPRRIQVPRDLTTLLELLERPLFSSLSLPDPRTL